MKRIYLTLALVLAAILSPAATASASPTDSMSAAASADVSLGGTADAAVKPMGTCTFGFLCGFVNNNLPSSYTVKIAELGVGSERCVTDKGTFTCKTYWLPSGKTSKDIGVKDADALTVENAAWTYGQSTWFSAGAWQKISDIESRDCIVENGHPACYQN